MNDYKDCFVKEWKLGRGAFGSVFKVTCRLDRRKCALKVIKPNKYKFTLRDVMEEYNLMASLEHDNIITTYGSYFSVYRDGRFKSFGIQMEYCRNGSLKKFLRKRRRRRKLLTRRELLDWMLDLSYALDYIHGQNIIHRDLKPDNILLGREHELKISDFGIGKIMTQYYATTAAGTPHFAAPEVFGSDRHSMKVDIYSLGKVFLCMATVRVVPRHLDDIPEKYGDEISDVIRDCVESKPRDRPDAATLLYWLRDI